MRNLKKFLSMLLAVMMIATAGIVVSAENEADYTEAVEVLKGIGVLKGYGDGNFGEKDLVTRIQFALLIARMVESKYTDADQTYFEEYYGDYEGAFSDMVTEDYDYSAYEGAANYCDLAGIVKGVSKEEKIFNPTGKITLDEAITMVCRAIGFDSDVWPVSFRIFANDNGLLENLETVDWKDELTREETAQLLYNLINVLSAGEYAYAGDKFVDFDEFEVVSEAEDTVWYNVFYNEGKAIAKMACPIVTADYDVLYDVNGEETEDAELDFTTIVCYELYDGTVAGQIVVGAYNNKIDAPAIVAGEETLEELEAVELRFIEIKDGVVTLEDVDDATVVYNYPCETLAGAAEIDFTALKSGDIATWVIYNDYIIDCSKSTVKEQLAILKSVALEEDAAGEFTGYLVAEVYLEEDGFEGTTTIRVRSVANSAFGFDWEWVDPIDADTTVEDLLTRENDLVAAYHILFDELADCAWIVTATVDAYGVYDLEAATLHFGEFETVNEFASKNVLATVDGIQWTDADDDGVIDDGELYNPCGVSSEFYSLVKVGDTNVYDAVGKEYTISENDKWVVVNALTGTVETFYNEPMEFQSLDGYYAYEALVENNTILVVVNALPEIVNTDNDEHVHHFDVAPRAQYVQVEKLQGLVKMNKTTIAIGDYKLPVYTYDYTVKGIVDVATGEALELVFEALTEAQFAAIKAEMGVWSDYLVPEFIYRFYENDGLFTEEIVPFMYFDLATWAQYNEEYDVYEMTLEGLTGHELIDKQSFFLDMFDVADDASEDDGYRYGLEGIRYLSYHGLECDAIDANYMYDVYCNFDEATRRLEVTFEKVGALVEADYYYKNVDDDADLEKFEYSLHVNMPGYEFDGMPIHYYENDTEEFGPQANGVYLPFGTNLVAYELGAKCETCEACGHYHYSIVEADEAYIKVAGDKIAVDFDGGVASVNAVAHKDEIKHVPNKGTVELGKTWQIQDAIDQWNNIASVSDLKNLTNNGINENAGEYIYWDGAEDLKVSYQKIDVKFHADYVGDPTERKWSVDYAEDFDTLEKWDYVNVAQLKIDSWTFLKNTDALEADYLVTEDGALEGHWFTYGTIVKTQVLGIEGNEYTFRYFDEKTEAEFLAQFKDGKVENGLVEKDDAPITQTIFKFDVTVVADYIKLYMESTCNENGEVDKVTLAFIDAVEVVDGKATLRDYDEDYNNVYVEDDVTGIVKVQLGLGTKAEAEVLEVKHVHGAPAYAVVKLVIDADREGDLVESDIRDFSILDEEWESMEDAAEDAFIVGATLAWSVLVEIIFAIRDAIGL